MVGTFFVFQVQDAIPASIGFRLSDEGPISTLSSNALYRRGQPIPSVKIITLQKNSSFNLDAFYIDENELPPGISTSIGNFQVCCLTLYNLFLQTSVRFCQD
jgi:heat shock 70kDa protein 4